MISKYWVKYYWCVMQACGADSLRSFKSLILVVRLIFPGGMEAQKIRLWWMRDDGGVWSTRDVGWSR